MEEVPGVMRSLRACALLLVLWPALAWADPVQDLVRRGWTEADLANVPVLIAEDVEATLRHPSLVRHYPGVRVRADLETDNWMADHPPIAAAVGRELGVFPFVVTESWPNTYVLEGGPLSRGSLTVLVRTDSRAVVFASARIRGALRSQVRTYAVACIRWWPAEDGAHIEHDIFIYGRLRSRTARWLALLMRPFSGPIITRRLYALIDGARAAAEAVATDPEGWAQRMNGRPDRGPADHLAWEQLIALQEGG